MSYFRDQYRYQKFISDIAGQDIHAHHGATNTLIEKLAGWLRCEVRNKRIPGGRAIAGEYQAFKGALPRLCAQMQLDLEEVTFVDFNLMAVRWTAPDPRHPR